jgi:hypothetical protein
MWLWYPVELNIGEGWCEKYTKREGGRGGIRNVEVSQTIELVLLLLGNLCFM